MEPEAAAWGCAEGFWGDNWAAIKCSQSSGCGPSPVTAALWAQPLCSALRTHSRPGWPGRGATEGRC